MKTIKQIANEIGVSRQAVHKKIKQEPLSTSLQKFMSTVGKTVYIEVDGECLIKSAFAKDDLSTLSNESVDKVDKKVDEVDSLSTKFIENLQEQIKLLSEQNKDLKDELKQEREHNRQQAERFADISEKLAELTRNSQVLLKQEQDKTAFLLPDESHESSSETPTKEGGKRRFWGFWKK